MSSNEQQPRALPLDAIFDIARDLTASLTSDNRYARLLAGVCRVIPCDAACLMRLEGAELVPLAARGLSRAALRQRYDRSLHPRLDALIQAVEPVRFAPDSPLPDPFDGLVAGAPDALEKLHDCMGCALVDDGEVVGVLTLDAFVSGTFDNIDRRLLATLGALAGATLRTSALLENLEAKAAHHERVARELSASAAVEWVGVSEAMMRVQGEIEIVAPSDLPLLITGETGVGKELVARWVHQKSRRQRAPLVHVNCAALPENLSESELFGHVAGAFTGATRDRLGKFEVADQGTLFLDEVGELPLALQSKLLVVLQSGHIQRVGSDRERRVNVRVLAATNRNLEQEVTRGKFRADLFHRLAAFPLHIPPLRERPEDIDPLVHFFADRARRRLGTGPVTFSPSALDVFRGCAWPGNVRELENAVGRAVLRAAHEEPGGAPLLVTPRYLTDLDGHSEKAPNPKPTRLLPLSGPKNVPLRERLAEFQRQQVKQALEDNHGSWAAAARDLGMHRSNLHHLAKRLKMDVAR